MSDWNEIKLPFRRALINSFNRSSLERVLKFYCDKRLDTISSISDNFEENVDDVIDDAVRNGWLEKLAAGALAQNPDNSNLRETVPHIVDGVEAEGKSYYQGNVFDELSEPLTREPDILELHEQLVDMFDLSELITFSEFHLGVDIDNLGGSGKSAKARELVLYMKRRGRLGQLTDEIQKEKERREDKGRR
jgi:hypothetical protein